MEKSNSVEHAQIYSKIQQSRKTALGLLQKNLALLKRPSYANSAVRLSRQMNVGTKKRFALSLSSTKSKEKRLSINSKVQPM